MQDRPGNNPVLSSGMDISPISDRFAPMGREFGNDSTGPILFFHRFTNRLRCFRHCSQSRRFNGWVDLAQASIAHVIATIRKWGRVFTACRDLFSFLCNWESYLLVNLSVLPWILRNCDIRARRYAFWISVYLLNMLTYFWVNGTAYNTGMLTDRHPSTTEIQQFYQPA